MHPKDELLATMGRIYQYRMTTTSGGNLSIREENGDHPDARRQGHAAARRYGLGR
jgi:hypothetical protein